MWRTPPTLTKKAPPMPHNTKAPRTKDRGRRFAAIGLSSIVFGQSSLLLFAQRRIVRNLQRPRQRLVVLAAVIRWAAGRLVGELVGRDEVLAPHLDRVHTQLVGH